MDNNTFIGCVAGSAGGAVYISALSTYLMNVTSYQDTFAGCSSDDYGGAFAMLSRQDWYGNLNIDAASFVGCNSRLGSAVAIDAQGWLCVLP